MSIRTLDASSGLSLGGAAGSATLMHRVSEMLSAWSERAQSRAELRKLDERLLRDIGLDPMTAETESNKPFWQA